MGASSAQVIQAWLVARLSGLLEIEPSAIDVREPFASYGIGSTEAVGLSGELGDWLGRSLAAELAYEYPTIESLARHLAGPSEEAPAAATSAAGEESENEPIAIIGLSCRFPGAGNAEAFWKLLCDGVDAISEVPAARFNVNAYYDADPSIPGKINTRWGGFLDRVDGFDAHFFGIAPREAERMDPQQRLILEVAWEALEDAGQDPARLAGSRTGVFVGISNNDYGRARFNDLSLIDAYAGTGNALSIAANRVSYVFDFQGPSIAIDTACSSSLVAVHQACASLRNGESSLALAAGVNLILSPAITVNFTKAGVMAPDGRCKAFDARANGYVRGEGAGVVVLKRLAQAQADCDRVYAVIRGSAVNQDGRSNGLMAPNPAAQEAVVREAYERAGISPGAVQYIEAHGTGTLLGDPIEAKALGKVLSRDRRTADACALGSVKTNIGHLEAAAGIAGLIKTALALKHRQIPASLHFREANPLIPFGTIPLRVQTGLEAWPAEIGRAVAGVSSFGFGGTNAHVVMAEAPAHQRTTSVGNSPGKDSPSRAGDGGRIYILPLSAANPAALNSLASAHRDLLATANEDISLHDLGYTASVRRGHLDYRLAVTGESRVQLAASLEAYLRGATCRGLSSGRRISSHARKTVFVFSGQGAQWFGMARRLLQDEAVFRAAIERCERALRRYCEWSLIGELTATDAAASRLQEIGVIQPTLFAIQIGLTALWRSWGIEPDAVVGHSMGEVAAACAAGALTLEDAGKIICERSRSIEPTIGRGAMAAVDLSLSDAQIAIEGYADRISIGVSNSPSSTVLSGDPEALAEVVRRLEERSVFCRTVKVDFAAHSPQMDSLQGGLSEALQGLRPESAKVPIYSTVTGKPIDGCELGTAYWVRNLREPVLFSAAVQGLLEEGYDSFIEISPHPILLSAIQQGAHHSGCDVAVLASLRREEDDRAVMLGAVGALYARGHTVEWQRFYPAGGRCAALPHYPWQRERHWLDLRATSAEEPVNPVSEPPDSVDDCLYELRWRPDRGEASRAYAAGGSWLILTDRSGVGEALARRIEAHGARCIRVAANDSGNSADSYVESGRDRFRIDPDEPEHLRQLLAAYLQTERSGCRGIVHLWSLDTIGADETTAASLASAQAIGCESVLGIVQQLAHSQRQDLPRMWLVTRGAQAVSEEPSEMSIAQAPLWGLGRVIAQEHPTLWGGLVDLEPGRISAETAADQLLQQIVANDDENQVAFRRGERQVARLVRRHRVVTPAAPLRLRADGTYLVTGGLGSLGLEIARWMVRQGARRLILMGRTRLPPRRSWRTVAAGSALGHQIGVIRELEALGASIHLAAVDVGDEIELGAYLDEFGAEGWPPIRGVVHAAGVLGDGLLSELETESFTRVMRPKVTGTWNLHRQLADDPLEFFVLCSSAGALLGQPGQGNYAAANAFLDSFAHYRRSQHQPALSINWGAWSNLGFANTPGGKRMAGHLASLGIESLESRRALAVLHQMIEQDATQAVAVAVDWARFRQFFVAGAASPLISELALEAAGSLPQTEKKGLSRDTLLGAEPSERLSLLELYLGGQVARVLGLAAEAVELDQPLSNLGLDSLMAVELKNRIAVDLGVNLPMVKFLEGPSVEQAALQVLGQLISEGTGAAAEMNYPQSGEDPKSALGREEKESDGYLQAHLDALTDDEVTLMISEILAEEEASE